MKAQQKHGFSEGKLKCRVNPSKINAFLSYIGGTVNNDVWNFSNGSYVNHGLNQQLNSYNILQIGCKSFSLNDGWKPCSNIIKQLVHIKFPHLKQLYLINNQITSIQIIAAMELPNLQILDVSSNQLVKVEKALNHCDYPKLKQLILTSNPVNELTCLSRMKCYDLQLLKLQSFVFRIHQKQGSLSQSLAWMMKLKSNQNIFIFAYGPRIHKQKTKDTLLKKFPQGIINMMTRQQRGQWFL